MAALHADSWRRHYRGSYPDSFLDGPVVENRLSVWAERLSVTDGSTVTIVAELSGTSGPAAPDISTVEEPLAGFAYVVLDDDRHWGALVDNLHVRHDLKGSGIGTELLALAARAVLEARPGSGLFLWVLEDNRAAQAFYRQRGARFEGTKVTTPPGGGPSLVALRCTWPDPATLLQSTRSSVTDTP